jgi:hypothetical protein
MTFTRTMLAPSLAARPIQAARAALLPVYSSGSPPIPRVSGGGAAAAGDDPARRVSAHAQIRTALATQPLENVISNNPFAS